MRVVRVLWRSSAFWALWTACFGLLAWRNGQVWLALVDAFFVGWWADAAFRDWIDRVRADEFEAEYGTRWPWSARS